MFESWNRWIEISWDLLGRGQHLEVPRSLPHPASAGFLQESTATPAGQCADWAFPLEDESRLHVHEFADGRLVAHRDKIDPNRGPLHALFHLAWETDLGRIALAIGALVVASKVIGSLRS
jgi:hypothetical protein